MTLINCEKDIMLSWSTNCVITNSIGKGLFILADRKFYVPVVTLSSQTNGNY